MTILDSRWHIVLNMLINKWPLQNTWVLYKLQTNDNTNAKM